MARIDLDKFRSGLKSVLKRLLPSWTLSINIRTMITKIVLILLVSGKVGARIPVFASSMPDPEPIVIQIGEDNQLSLSELWDALNPTQRAMLAVLEIRVPNLAEELLDESPETINAFFHEAETKLFNLPVWSEVESLAENPNLPQSLPEGTQEIRTIVQQNGILEILTAEAGSDVQALAGASINDLLDNSDADSINIWGSIIDFDGTETLIDNISENILDEVLDRRLGY